MRNLPSLHAHPPACRSTDDTERGDTFSSRIERVFLVVHQRDFERLKTVSRPAAEDDRRGHVLEYSRRPPSDVAGAIARAGSRYRRRRLEPIGGPEGPPKESLRKNLAGIENTVRIERRLDAFHQRDLVGRQLEPTGRRLREPDAVLAADRPFERDHPREEESLRLLRARGCSSASPGFSMQVDVDVAVAGVSERRDRAACRSRFMSAITSNSSGTRPRGTTTSWLIFTRPVALSATDGSAAARDQIVSRSASPVARVTISARRRCGTRPRRGPDPLRRRARRAVDLDDQRGAGARRRRVRRRGSARLPRASRCRSARAAAGTTRRRISPTPRPQLHGYRRRSRASSRSPAASGRAAA